LQEVGVLEVEHSLRLSIQQTSEGDNTSVTEKKSYAFPQLGNNIIQ